MDIKLRNIIVLFVSLSLLIFINYQVNQKYQSRRNIQQLVKNIFKNQTDQQLNQLVQSQLAQKLRFNMPASHCLARLYLNVNQYLLQSKSSSQYAKMIYQNKDWQNIKTCGDVVSLMHYEYPTQTQRPYSNYLSQKYGSFDSNLTNSYCVLINQFNNSLTTLKKSISSVLNQEYQHFKLIVLDNHSEDGSYQISKVFLQEWKQEQVLNGKGTVKLEDLNKKYKLIKSKTHLSEQKIINTYIKECGTSDYVILLDGRDQLLGEYIFQIINSAIKNTKYELITASVLSADSYSKYDQIDTFQHPYHFKAFSAKLWSKVNQQIEQLNLQNEVSNKQMSYLIMNKMLEAANQNKQSGLAHIDQILSVFHQIGKDRNRYEINRAKSSRKQNAKKDQQKITTQSQKTAAN